MTIEEFRKVVNANWIDKCIYYLMYVVFLVLGIVFLYDTNTNPAKYAQPGLRVFAFILGLFLIVIGILGIYLIPNYYKILSVNSALPIDKKEEIINALLKELDIGFDTKKDDYYSFRYSKRWFSASYRIRLNIDTDRFDLSVQRNNYRGGLIDLGGTEKMRQRIINSIEKLIDIKS